MARFTSSVAPVTDGEHLVVLFGSEGLYFYDLDGTLPWTVDVGAVNAGASCDDTYRWGSASSPIIYRGLVIVQADQQRDSFIAAYDIASGEEVWPTPRDVISSFATPNPRHGRLFDRRSDQDQRRLRRPGEAIRGGARLSRRRRVILRAAAERPGRWPSPKGTESLCGC